MQKMSIFFSTNLIIVCSILLKPKTVQCIVELGANAPSMWPKGSVEPMSMDESKARVQSLSMEDAWPENSVFSNPSAGYSPMDIDAKISQKIVPKSANEEEPKSKLYEMVLQKLGKMGMSDDKFGNVEMAKGNQVIAEMITKGPMDFVKMFYLTNSKTISERLRTTEQLLSASTGISATNFMKFYDSHQARSDFEKLTLLMETWQAQLGGPSRCDNQVKLKEFKRLIKISDMFFSTDEQKLGESGTARVYRGNSEYLGSCVAIKVIPFKRLDMILMDQYRKEVAILNILAGENYQHSIRLYRSQEKDNQLTMALEFGVMDLRKLWMTHKRKFDKDYKELEEELEKSPENWKKIIAQKLPAHYSAYWERKRMLTSLMEHLFKEMIEAVAEFHHIGMHLDLKLDNFMAIPDELNGTIIGMENGQIKVRTKLINFGAANLINPDRYRADLPQDVRQKMVIDPTACAKLNVAFGTLLYMAPEQVKFCNGFYMVSTKADIWAMGAVLYEMIQGNPPYAVLCHKMHPKSHHWDGANMEESLIRMTEYQKCLYSMAKDPEAVAKIEYPSHARMVQDGTSHLWNIIKASLQFDARLRPTAQGILAYLRRECRLQINKMGDLVGYFKDVPSKRCEMDLKEGQVISGDPHQFRPI